MIGRRNTLLHVLAVRYMADGDEGRNFRVGLGSKPQGGMASAPVANIRMSANRSMASPSEKHDRCHIHAYVHIYTVYIYIHIYSIYIYITSLAGLGETECPPGVSMS